MYCPKAGIWYFSIYWRCFGPRFLPNLQKISLRFFRCTITLLWVLYMHIKNPIFFIFIRTFSHSSRQSACWRGTKQKVWNDMQILLFQTIPKRLLIKNSSTVKWNVSKTMGHGICANTFFPIFSLSLAFYFFITIDALNVVFVWKLAKAVPPAEKRKKQKRNAKHQKDHNVFLKCICAHTYCVDMNCPPEHFFYLQNFPFLWLD